MSEERFNRIETKLDGVVADVAVLKTDVAVLKTDVAVLKTDVAGLKTDVCDLKAGQASMEERLTARMLMLHEDTKDTLRAMNEEHREVVRQVRGLWEMIPGIRAALANFTDSNRHFSRVLDNHERRITDLENQPGR
jgi:hypothetical protein